MKISLVVAELFYKNGRKDGRTDDETDMTKLIVSFRNLRVPPRKISCVLYGSQHK